MTGITIQAMGWHLPETGMTVADLPELADMSTRERQTCTTLGIERVPVDDHADSRTLAVRAAQRVLADTGMTGIDLDALVLVEPRVPKALLTSEVTAVQAALGAGRAMSFSVGGLGCASITPALLTARGMLHADPHLSTVLIAHGSKPPTSRRYRHPVTVQGDCGFAVLLSRNGPLHLLDVVLESDGDYSDLFRVDYRDVPVDQWREECLDIGKYSLRLAVTTRDRLRSVNQRLLQRNGLRQEDIAGYLCQNISLAALRFYQESLGVAMESACADNLRHRGHLGPADALLNLQTTLDRNRWHAGDRVVLLNVSPVAAWSAVLIEITTAGADEDILL
ncbi:3-oxoacyl-[acyl-carrier-protein] synthase III C-terminal domain-containing protein [Umezawaea sp. Da 62-37]|uniref:3-oxoacyl-[acyl-carrier-protein] synthase III C-terminal domain-containing protein n=1 Tax=Umezawaea sp. Da 62-37 TaxID=3075927 RepID=UPI0028F6D945|nr:3-oxoacyl-[acyl-carrier-protein] synthase III C-terminal domain-containing protein [Umezawaea sp. Da 62-37]WNV85209.1 3-oxoacyl-[acyl-carrier-protein] synthase III C-terminal domain-containing protein [Umezawaea sp. Da 62-37]